MTEMRVLNLYRKSVALLIGVQDVRTGGKRIGGVRMSEQEKNINNLVNVVAEVLRGASPVQGHGSEVHAYAIDTCTYLQLQRRFNELVTERRCLG